MLSNIALPSLYFEEAGLPPLPSHSSFAQVLRSRLLVAHREHEAMRQQPTHSFSQIMWPIHPSGNVSLTPIADTPESEPRFSARDLGDSL